jgi:enterochelin esterase-like enzyme
MQLNLLGQNLSLIICGVATTLFVLLVNFLVKALREATSGKGKSKKKLLAKEHDKRRQLIILLTIPVLSLPLAFVLRALIGHYTDSDIPVGLAFMILPTTASLFLLVAVWLRKPKILVGLMSVGCFIICILFSLVLINSYYRDYPTLGSVFNKNEAIALKNNLAKQVLVSYAPIGSTLFSDKSVEYDLTSISHQPTSGKLYSLAIPGTVSKFHPRKAYVYVPAIYNNPTTIYLPVVVLTVGSPGTPEDWVNSGLQKTMDAFAQHHSGIAPLVFVVDDSGAINNDTECVDSSRGNIETYLTVDVPNYIKANFNTETDSSHWAIGGLSMGGTCSIMLALRHPNVYHYFLDFGGEMAPEDGNMSKTIKTLFNGSQYEWQQHQPEYLMRTRSYKNMGGYFAVGSTDVRAVTDAATELSVDANKAGIDTVYVRFNGQHTFNVWQQALKQSLPWVSNRIGATECQTTCL